MDVLQTASAVMEKAKKLLHRRGVTFSIPSSAVLEQVDSYKMLEALNESVQEKLEQLTKCTVCFSFSPFSLYFASRFPFHCKRYFQYGLRE